MISVDRLSLWLFGIGLILSQFYFFKSGLPQPAHFLLILPVVLFFIGGRRFVILPDRSKVPLLVLLLFMYTTIVNLVYGFVHGKVGFIVSVVYFFYGALLFYTLQNLLLFVRGGREAVSFFLILGVLILFFVAVAGWGDYKFYPRYNAYFNDPNQMAFWALCVSSMILVQRSIGGVVKAFVFAFLLLIIMKSASRSGIVGLSLLVAGFSIEYLSGFIFQWSLKRLGVAMVGALVVAILSSVFLKSDVEAIKFIEERISQVDLQDQADIRGYSRISNFPEYIFLGAGQGHDGRFSENANEVHSTWAALLFYYGIPGVALMALIVFLISKGMTFSQNLIFLSPLLYSFSTLGYRTPIFWVFISFFYCYAMLGRCRGQ